MGVVYQFLSVQFAQGGEVLISPSWCGFAPVGGFWGPRLDFDSRFYFTACEEIFSGHRRFT